MEVLKQRIQNVELVRSKGNLNNKRKNQVGSGMRGDKIRTVRIKDNKVISHQTGNKISYKKYEKGYIWLL